jgi:hypothetical protein
MGNIWLIFKGDAPSAKYPGFFERPATRSLPELAHLFVKRMMLLSVSQKSVLTRRV